MLRVPKMEPAIRKENMNCECGHGKEFHDLHGNKLCAFSGCVCRKFTAPQPAPDVADMLAWKLFYKLRSLSGDITQEIMANLIRAELAQAPAPSAAVTTEDDTEFHR